MKELFENDNLIITYNKSNNLYTATDKGTRNQLINSFAFHKVKQLLVKSIDREDRLESQIKALQEENKRLKTLTNQMITLIGDKCGCVVANNYKQALKEIGGEG